jgi:putative chitinase
MLLKKGDNNDSVKQLQVRLGVEAIGTFGPKTEAAVIAWQKANGLTADGIVGDGTWGKLFPTTTQPTPAVVSAPTTILVSSFKLDKLKGHIPDSVIAAIPDTAAKFNITNVLRLAHFLAQAGHESGQFKATSENLNYSSKGLLGIFPRYFNAATAEQYARKPEMIASKVYGGRMGNGAEPTQEGYKFRGRGPIQLTGKANYQAFATDFFEDPETVINDPDLVTDDVPTSLYSALWFWNKNKINKYADASDIKGMTKVINGGYIGLEDRIKHYNHAIEVLEA